mgnify:CR=1 FL=1
MMEAKMKELPPEKRAMVEEDDAGAGRGTAAAGRPEALSFAKTGSDKVGVWPCDRYAASGDGRKVEVCAAEASDARHRRGRRRGLRGLPRSLEKMAGEAHLAGRVHCRPRLRGLRSSAKRPVAVSSPTASSSRGINQETVPAGELQVPAGLQAVTPGTASGALIEVSAPAPRGARSLVGWLSICLPDGQPRSNFKQQPRAAIHHDDGSQPSVSLILPLQ